MSVAAAEALILTREEPTQPGAPPGHGKAPATTAPAAPKPKPPTGGGS